MSERRSRRQPIRIGDEVFATKKAAGDRIREILYRYGIGHALGAADESFMRDVLALHPESEQKIGVGVARIEVRQNMGSRGFWVVRTDGSATDFSFLACLTPPTHEHDVRRALRTAVRDQVRAFRDRELVPGARCAVTMELLDGLEVHVDHDPPFEDLVRAFMAARGLSFGDMAVVATADGATDTVLADHALAAEWSVYHAEHARLRLTTRHANLSVLRRQS